MKKTFALLLLVVIIFSGSACGSVDQIVSTVAISGEYPVTIGETTLSSRPSKAVVLSGNIADIMIELGNVTQLIAGSEDCVQPDLRDLNKVSAGDPQAVISLSPDVVISDNFTDEMLSALNEANIPAVSIAPADDRKDLERLYGQISSVFSGGGSGFDKGVVAAQKLFTRLDDVSRITQSDIISTGCYLYDTTDKAVTGDMFSSLLLSYAGLTDAFKSLSGGSYDLQTLKLANPTVIFCPVGIKEKIMGNVEFANLQAVKLGKVYEIDEHLMQWQGSSVITTTITIAGFAFPELLETTSAAPKDPTSTPEEISAPPGDIEDESEDEEEGVSSAPSDASESSSEPTTYVTLQDGDSGDDVMRLQDRLSELNYLNTEYDGHYGDYTFNAVLAFQVANDLAQTGVADNETQQLLFSENAKPAEAE